MLRVAITCLAFIASRVNRDTLKPADKDIAISGGETRSNSIKKPLTVAERSPLTVVPVSDPLRRQHLVEVSGSAVTMKTTPRHIK